MRKGIVLFMILAVLVTGFVSAQSQSKSPTMVTKAKYFDVTPPLRDMPVVLPGERDRSWKDGVIGNFLDPQVSEENRTRFAHISDAVVQGQNGRSQHRGPLLSVDGVGNVNGVLPPDTDGDVGPDHYFQMINLSFAIFDKQGNNIYGPVDNSTLWSGFIGPWTGTNDGDPIVLYDELADRWIATQFAIHTSNDTFWELIAVSQTGDPLGPYYRYAFEYPAFNDYPHFGVWHDGYYASFNMFENGNNRAGISAFDRESMLEGDPDAEMVYYDMWGTMSMMPADMDGPAPPDGAPNYFAHLKTWSTQDMEIYEFDVDWENTGNSSVTLAATLFTDPFNPDVGRIPQPGTGQKLDAISDRLMYRLAYRNFDDYEVLLTNHTVKVGNHAGVRWYELRKESGGEWYIYQQSTYSPDDENRWMGSIAMNGDGEIALGYTVSSSTTHPSVRYTGRASDAPLGEMNYTEMELVSGSSSQSSYSRWGDYSCMSVDPVDDYTFWYTQEYMGGGWRTRIGSFDFGPTNPPLFYAGNDTVICENQAFSARPTALYVSSVLWSTDGDGRFIPDPPTKLNQSYIRGAGDILNGGFSLSAEAEGYEPGVFVYDTVHVTIVRYPISFAGNDTLIPAYSSITLNGSVMYATGAEWSTDGDGIFDDIGLLDATYIPGLMDISNGNVELALTAYPDTPCDQSDTDKIIVTLDHTIGIEDMNDSDLKLEIIPNPVQNEFLLKINSNTDETCEIKIMNQAGETIFQESNNLKSGTLQKLYNVSTLAKGLYFISVKTNTNYRVEKVILQ